MYTKVVKQPKRNESTFTRIKLATFFTVIFACLGFTSSYLGVPQSEMWFDLTKITLGFLFGSGISAGYSK